MLWVIIVGLLVGLMIVNTGFSQTKPDQPTGKAQSKITLITMNGNITKDKVSGGYIVIHFCPARPELRITV